MADHISNSSTREFTGVSIHLVKVYTQNETQPWPGFSKKHQCKLKKHGSLK